MSLDRYKSIIKLDTNYNNVKVPTYVPEISEVDYQRGYIKRYFIQKSNDQSAPIFEISENDFSNYSSNSFYVVVFLDWRLIGSDEEIKNSNFKSVKLAAKNMPALQLYLPNLLQFRKK